MSEETTDAESTTEAGTASDDTETAGAEDEPVEFAKFGAVTYMVAAVGLFIVALLEGLLGDDEGAVFTGNETEFFSAAGSAIGAADPTLSIILAALLVGYFHWKTDYDTLKASSIAVAAGVAAVAVVFLLLMVVFEPDGVDISIGDELTGLIGVLLGNVGFTALLAYLLTEDPIDLFE